MNTRVLDEYDALCKRAREDKKRRKSVRSERNVDRTLAIAIRQEKQKLQPGFDG